MLSGWVRIMKFIVDTHVFLWIAADPEKLSKKAELCIKDTGNSLYLSIASLWEMQVKIQLGKLDLDMPLDELWYQQQIKADLSLLPIKEEHIWELGLLPHVHKDPFDRLLIAQSKHEKMGLITADKYISRYYTTVIW